MAEIKANEIYTSALAIMNERDADNSYKDRCVPLINALMSQCYQYTEDYESGSRSGWTPITGLDDVRANSWQQQYEEGLLNARRVPHEIGQITDVYGCFSAEKFGAW